MRTRGLPLALATVVLLAVPSLPFAEGSHLAPAPARESASGFERGGPFVPAALPRSSASLTPGFWGWYNATPGMPAAHYYDGSGGASSPPPLEGPAIATDPNGSSEGPVTAMFGGETSGGQVSDQTWVYREPSADEPNEWVNVTTPADSPPALAWASMDFDPNIGSFVLFGGVNAAGVVEGQTWLLNPKTLNWTNESASACFFYCPSAVRSASLAFAPEFVDNATILFGGCADANCSITLNSTYELANISGTPLWKNVSSAVSPSPRYGAAMSKEIDGGSEQFVVLVGGAMNASSAPLSDTWEYYNHSWTNLTAYPGVLHGAPTALVGAGSQFVPGLAGVLLIGGSAGSDSFSRATWFLTCQGLVCTWENRTSDFGGVPAEWLGLLSEGPGLAPATFGGLVSAKGEIENSTWVLENYSHFQFAVSSESPEVRQPIWLNFTLFGEPLPGSPASGGFAVWWLTPSSGLATSIDSDADVSHSLPSSGMWNVSATVIDLFGIGRMQSWRVDASGPNATAGASVSATDTGIPVDFTSTLTGTHTSSNISYRWTFGDGATSSSASTSHAYAKAGNYTAEVEITDGLGNSAFANVTVSVNPRPTAAITSSAPTTDQNQSILFSATISDGTAPFAYKWTFGGHAGVSTSPSPIHAFNTSGNVSVNLTVTDRAGVMANATFVEHVEPALLASAYTNVSAASVGAPVRFSVSATGGSGVYVYNWSFGDGARANGNMAVHAYNGAGNYTATVWINDSFGSSISRRVQVTVVPAGARPVNGVSHSGVALWIWGPIAGLLIAALLLAAYLFDKQRARGKPAGPPSTGAAPKRPAPPRSGG